MSLYEELGFSEVEESEVKGELYYAGDDRLRHKRYPKDTPRVVYGLVECPHCDGVATKRPGASTPTHQSVKYRCIMDNDCSWSFERTL